MKPVNMSAKDYVASLGNTAMAGPNPWGKRLLNRFKTVNGKRLQLHATKGWRVA